MNMLVRNKNHCNDLRDIYYHY